MALNFEKIISESENVSLEDLSFESFDQTDLDPESITLNDLFEDRLSFFNQGNGGTTDDMADQGLFDIDVDCTDLEKVWISDCDINDSFQFADINLTDFEPSQSSISVDNDDAYVSDSIAINDNDNDSSESYKKNSTIIRRQSTRIQNQTRKKIAEQIQRENIRLAMEAQYLNTHSYSRKKVNPSTLLINGKPPSPAMGKNMAMPTDLDAEDVESDTDNVEVTSDDDPNKLWCICRQPYGERFMICCDNCLEWYHGDCVGVTQKEGSDMDEFICPPCVSNSSANTTTVKSEEIVIIDDDDDEEEKQENNANELLGADDDDCLITKSVVPSKFTSNIFQLIKKSQHLETDKPCFVKAPMINLSSLSSRTSVCLNVGCKTLVNPKKSLYCSRICIDKYTRMVIKNNHREKAKQYGLPKGPKLAKMTRFVLAQPATETIQDEFAAPTEETLKEFLLKNPTYKVYQSANPVKSKQDQEKSKKFLELLNMDPSKHIKVVKHFAILFKKSMPLKTFNTEFRNIWQHCVKMEEGIFENCDKLINDKYMLKVKQMSEYLRHDDINKLCWDILHDKLSISDLLSMDRHQLETRSKTIVLDDQPVLSVDKQNAQNKTFVATRGGISLLADTTHLHGKHLYDIKCRVCNGTSKSSAENKNKEKESVPSMENVISSCTELPIAEDVPSPINNDEFKVTSSVATPDLAVDMDICSTPSEKDVTESNINSDLSTDTKVDSSSKDVIKTNSVVKPQKRKLLSLWEGDLTYKEVGSVACKAYLVTRYFLDKSTVKEPESLSGSKEDLREDIDIDCSVDSQILINGRSQLSVVQDYLRKLRKHSNKEFLILRLHPSNLEEGRQTYLSMFEFFHSRERCGVVSHKKIGVKDCFIYPLNAHAKIPQIFLPFNGPGLEKSRPHLLLLLIVRTPLAHQYQPISPKYDEDHDFVKKHGINLDKYHKPNANLPFCPSPIATPDSMTNSKIYIKPVSVKDDICKVENPKDDTSKIENIKMKSEEKVVNDCDDAKISEIPQIDLLNIPLPPSLPDNINEPSIVVSIPSKEPITALVSIKLPIVVTQLPVNITPDCSFTPKAFVYRSLVKPSNKSNLQTNLDLNSPVEKEPKPNPTVNPDIFENNRVTYFVPESNTEKTVNDKIDLFSAATHLIKSEEDKLSCRSPVTDVDKPKDTQVSCSVTSENSSFCQDVDFRLTTPSVPELSSENSDEQFIEIESQNRFLKRKCSNRLYTYYDSFERGEGYEEKRQKYFFNPHNQMTSEDISRDSRCQSPMSPPSPSSSLSSSTPPPPPPPPQAVTVSVNCGPTICGGVILKKNVSVFSPPGDNSKL